MGVTAENREYGLPRLNDLQKTNGKNKHICCEPLLGDLGQISREQIRLVVDGEESGKNARRGELEWVESLQAQCRSQNVDFYWKQWGSDGPDGVYGGRGKTGHLINGKSFLSFPDDLMP